MSLAEEGGLAAECKTRSEHRETTPSLQATVDNCSALTDAGTDSEDYAVCSQASAQSDSGEGDAANDQGFEGFSGRRPASQK
ncbi:hypothetical protein VTO73DRAFT_4587 [Trametes versicolor]